MSSLNLTVSMQRPFCQSTDAMFCCYMECERRQGLLRNEKWIETIFLSLPRGSRGKMQKSSTLYIFFLVGQAALQIKFKMFQGLIYFLYELVSQLVSHHSVMMAGELFFNSVFA